MSIETEMNEIGKNAQNASFKLKLLSTKKKNDALHKMADALVANMSQIIEKNKIDVSNAEKDDLTKAKIERLVLNESRINDMARGIREVAALKDPVGEEVSMWKKPNGLRVGRVRVPLGVVGIIYESRPNVTADVAALCLKSGNAVILRGGSEAINSNSIIADVLNDAANNAGIPENSIQLIKNTDREFVRAMLKLNRYIDVIIPRGGAGLIQMVIQNATVPTIETGVGVDSTFVNYDADFEMAKNIIINAKTQRPAVCNALDKLLVHEKIKEEFIPFIVEEIRKYGVEVRGDNETKNLVPDVIPATEEDWGTEYLDLIMCVRVVKDVAEAIDIITKYDTKHSEAIITNNDEDSQKFLNEVDAAAVYVNASTRFTDGGQFGLGAEMGISTQKLHCRGPFALEALTSTKFVVYGSGQIRE
jgi:glutamate-5-semialdehyde dehydrogenase